MSDYIVIQKLEQIIAKLDAMAGNKTTVSFSTQSIVVPDPLTEEFVKKYWYGTVSGTWEPAGRDYLMPSQLISDEIEAAWHVAVPGKAPEGWQWEYNPDTKMIAARKMCGPIGT